MIDYGDASMGWRVAELAIACVSAFHYQPDWPLGVVDIVESFDVEVPLLDKEIDALWPLIVLRGATLVVSGEQQVAIDPENHYARSAREREWMSFEVPAEFDWSVATEAIRLRLGRERSAHSCEGFEHSMLPGSPTSNVIDLGYASRSLSNGSWLMQPLAEERRLLRAALSDGRVATTRFGESRLTRSLVLDRSEPINVALAIDLLVSNGPSEVAAPFGGEATIIANAFVLVGETHSIFIEGMVRPRLGTVASGEAIGETIETLTVWLATNDRNLDVTRVPPHFVRRSEYLAWTRRFEDPTALLGMAPSTLELPVLALGLSRRNASYHPLQSHYYSDPPQIERGWREHLIDVNARHYLDMVNNVTLLGHGHPKIAEVAADQWRMLNTNSRFHYDAVTELSERLLSTLPSSFDSVLLVNSGTEAVDLALRLTKAFSGREDVMCVTESYHGWSMAADAVSTSVSDNPRANETRPAWVHATPTPNAYRGRHRGPDAGPAYAADTIDEMRRHATGGRPIGTFIIEPRGGNAGAIEVPSHYLSAVFNEIRSGGGVCISDETQVGFGRQGDVFWGFQQHPGVVP
ncbi:MAG: aminotransferase class III-fold pyridoxal phosphate-dependent enzyme, partial [Acidimicrobiales bacterium]